MPSGPYFAAAVDLQDFKAGWLRRSFSLWPGKPNNFSFKGGGCSLMLWARSLCSASGATGENATCSRQVMWLPLRGGCLVAAAWEEQPPPSTSGYLRAADGGIWYSMDLQGFQYLLLGCSELPSVWTPRGGRAKGRMWAWAVASPVPFCLCLVVFLLWCACRVGGFIRIREVQRGYLGERQRSIHTTLCVWAEQGPGLEMRMLCIYDSHVEKGPSWFCSYVNTFSSQTYITSSI